MEMLWPIITAAAAGGIVYVGMRHRIKKLEAMFRELRWILDTDTYPRLHAIDNKGDKPPVRPPEPV